MASFESKRTKAYESDLRWRMVYQSSVQGLTLREIASNLNVDHSTVCRVLKIFEETGNVEPGKSSGRPKTLNVYDEFIIIENVLENPSIYLHEIKEDLRTTTGRELDESTICRFLHRNGFSRQKLRLVAQQRNQELRQRFMTECSAYRPEMFVFVDETGSDRRNAMRKFGYSLVGKTPSVSRLLVRGKCFSAIAALTLDGIIATLVTSNTVTAVTFEEFIVSKLLTKLMPFNGVNPNSILVLDNATIHHVQSVLEVIKDTGCLLLFLPPYSPDLNPIEETFSKIKYELKANDALIQKLPEGGLPDMIQSAFDTVSPEDSYGWFKHSGYIIPA